MVKEDNRLGRRVEIRGDGNGCWGFVSKRGTLKTDRYILRETESS